MGRGGQVGAYGFRLVPADPSVELPGLVAVDEGADEARIDWRVEPTTEDVREVGDERIVIAVREHVRIEVDRPTRSIFIALPEPPTPEAIVHPVATTPLAILARWRGDAALHAGAVLHAGGAWVVCGNRGAGKSTALALLAQRGLPVVADDLVVISDGHVLSGPSCVDLRADTAPRFPDARFLGVVGARERWRIATPAPPARVPVRGLFLLEWGDDPKAAVAPLDLRERAAVVHGFDYAALVGLPRAEVLLDLLALPMWRLTRPKTPAGGNAALDRLLETASAH